MDKKARKDIAMGETSSIPVKVIILWLPSHHDVDAKELSVVRIADARTECEQR